MLSRTTAFLILSLMAPAWADEWRAPPSAGPATGSASIAPDGVWKGGVLVLPPGSAEILKASRSPRTIIVGNPAVVDASVVGEGTIAVTAKAAGITNIILLDANQAEITRGLVQVGPAPRTIQVMQGDKRQEYACTTGCIAVAAPPPTASYTTTYSTRDAQGNPTATMATTTVSMPDGVAPLVPPSTPPVAPPASPQ